MNEYQRKNKLVANSRQTVFINDDIGVDIQYNPDLSDRQFLLKIIGWDGWHEYRMSVEDMLNFAGCIADFTLDRAKDAVYTDGLAESAKLRETKND